MPDSAPITTQALTVLPATALVVTEGVARGEAMGIADDLVMDDIYQLDPEAARATLVLVVGDDPRVFAVAEGSATGQAGNLLVIDCCVTLMAPDGTTLEVLVLVEVDDGSVAQVHLLPLAPLRPRADYRLVGLDRHAGTTRLAEVACSSFARGTRITMASGRQVRVEDLAVGDRVLTRDDGPRPIRWIGQTTLRAVGAFAPVLIHKGALHNANDLLLSPDHRIFIWQREDRIGAGRSEVLVKVRHLVNGRDVVQLDGGFVDYFQLLFDDHQIIFAEGIAAESLFADPRTRAALPGEVAAATHGHRRHLGYEVQENLLSQRDAVALLRRASQAD